MIETIQPVDQYLAEANQNIQPLPQAEVQRVSEVANTPAEYLEGARVQDVSKGPAVIDTNAADINGNGLLAVITVGGEAVKVYGIPSETGGMEKGYFMITDGSYDDTQKEASENAQILRMRLIGANNPSVVVGRDKSSHVNREFFELTHNKVSRQHLQLNLNSAGQLVVTDLESTNGTKLITKESTEFNEARKQEAQANLVGTLVINESYDRPSSPERQVGEFTYRLNGIISEERKGIYSVTSVDAEGQENTFFVYRSGSEGSLRVSQGLQTLPKGARYLKGGEDGDFHQYTQETQLHPDFAEAFREMVGERSDLAQVSMDTFKLKPQEVAEATAKFESEVVTYRMGSEKLTRELLRTRSGGYRVDQLSPVFGVRPEEIPAALDAHFQAINDELKASGAVPEFTEPTRIEHDYHPVLGAVTREVFTVPSQGRTLEWYMVSDTTGRVWIDRIRFAESKQTSYGTDKELAFSGILTSKPVEYASQTTGLPDRYVAPSVGRYVDITGMLEQFHPVQKYRQQRGVYRTDTAGGQVAPRAR